jgi:hypothetical protein
MGHVAAECLAKRCRVVRRLVLASIRHRNFSLQAQRYAQVLKTSADYRLPLVDAWELSTLNNLVLDTSEKDDHYLLIGGRHVGKC